MIIIVYNYMKLNKLSEVGILKIIKVCLNVTSLTIIADNWLNNAIKEDCSKHFKDAVRWIFCFLGNNIHSFIVF